MKISDLKECIKLAQTLNFTQTARDFYITQPVLSKHISNLERDLGVQLFVRNQHGVAVTEIGRAFIKDAAEVVAKFDQSIENVNRKRAGKGSTLTVGYLLGASKKILPHSAAQFVKTHPDVSLQFLSLELDIVLKALDAQRINVGITTSFNNPNYPSTRYNWEPLYPDGVAVVVPKNHRFAGRKSLRVVDLAGEHLLQSAPPFMTDDTKILLQLLDPIRERVVVHKEACDLSSLTLLMETGSYISVTFAHIANYFDDNFVCIPLEEAAGMKCDVGVTWRRVDENQAILDFVKTLKAQVAHQL